MYKNLILSVALIMAGARSLAQHTEKFNLGIPEKKVSGSLYTKITFLDSRADTTQMGFVQTGALNRRAIVVPEVSFGEQLSKMLTAMVQEPAQQGELLFQLRQSTFSEVTGAISEKGYFNLRAKLYAAKDGKYQEIGYIDNKFSNGGMDVTNGLLKGARYLITEFIAGNLLNAPTGPLLSRYDVSKIDSVEKSKLPVYTADTFADGLYLNFASFFNQHPDSQFELTGNDLNSGTVKAPDASGALKKVRPGKVYAIVHKGQPYIVANHKYFPLKRENGDLVFTGTGYIPPSTGEVIAASAIAGALGSVVVTTGHDGVFEMKVDHINGELLRLREVKGTR